MMIEMLREVCREDLARLRWASNEPLGWPLYRVQNHVVMATRVWVATDAFQAVRASCADLWVR